MTGTVPLWLAADAAAATGGVQVGDWAATGISIDSRSLAAGDLFVALKGPKFDGHEFITDAFAKNAAAAIVEEVSHTLAGQSSRLVVKDTSRALNDLSRFGRDRCEAVVVAITGSVGKTSLKSAVAEILSHQGDTASSYGSYNNHIGVPLSLARMPAGTRYGVFELGMNHAGELHALTALVRPHVVVITNVEAAHLEFFASVEEIADAKAEIFTGLMPGGITVLNRDNSQFERLVVAAHEAEVAHIISFGRDAGADVRAMDVATTAEGSQVTADVAGTVKKFTLAEPGDHWVMNALAALSTVLAVDGDIHMAANDLRELTPVARRGLRRVLNGGGLSFELIDDSYNASPAAVQAALSTLKFSVPRIGGRRIAILGDMLELGPSSSTFHTDLVAPIAAASVDLVFAAGPLMRNLHDALPGECRGGWAETAEQLAPLVTAAVHNNDVVLVKGSAGTGMSRIVDTLRGLCDG